jgi:hypothetical protein
MAQVVWGLVVEKVCDLMEQANQYAAVVEGVPILCRKHPPHPLEDHLLSPGIRVVTRYLLRLDNYAGVKLQDPPA